MNRTHGILAALLAVQLILILLIRAPAGGGGDDGGGLLVPQLAGLEPIRIEIVGKDDKRLELVRGADGWSLPAVDGFPADSEKVDRLLDDLRTAEIRRPVVRSARYHESFSLTEKKFEGRLRIWADDDDSPGVDLLLGSASNYRTTHARLADRDEVYEVEGLAPYDLRPRRETWIRKALLGIESSRIATLRIDNAAGAIDVTRDATGWSLDGAPAEGGLIVDAAAVDALARTLTELRLVDAVGAVDDTRHDLATPTASVDMLLDDGERITLRIGGAADEDDGKRYVALSTLSQVTTVWKTGLAPILNATRDGLLRPAPAADETEPIE